jgi:GT2 family glycosyltransferase
VKGISVIIPTLHRTEFTLDTIKYLVVQECAIPFEIIVIDQSNSIDEKVKKMCNEFDFCTYYHIDFFKGLPEARNFGWQKAKYDFILFVDDDIQCDKNLVQQHFNILNQNNVGVVAGGIVEVFKENQECKVGDFNFWTATPLRGFHKEGTFEVLHGGGGNFSTKKEVLLKVNGIDENLTKGAALYEETDFCLRVKKAGYKIMFHSLASVNHLAAETGGCRVEDIGKYIGSLVRNRSIIIRRHLTPLQKFIAHIFLLKLVMSYFVSYKKSSLIKQYFKSLFEGIKIGKNKVICTKYE